MDDKNLLTVLKILNVNEVVSLNDLEEKTKDIIGYKEVISIIEEAYKIGYIDRPTSLTSTIKSLGKNKIKELEKKLKKPIISNRLWDIIILILTAFGSLAAGYILAKINC